MLEYFVRVEYKKYIKTIFGRQSSASFRVVCNNRDDAKKIALKQNKSNHPLLAAIEGISSVNPLAKYPILYE